MNLFSELLMHVHELHMNMHEHSSSDELHFSGAMHYVKTEFKKLAMCDLNTLLASFEIIHLIEIYT